jgi:hypothetical protein
MLLTAGGSVFSKEQDSAKNSRVTDFRLSKLNGHKFVVNSNIGSPFVNTYIQNRVGLGQTLNVDIPELEIQGVPVQIKGELLFTFLKLEYQQSIKDWLAFRASFDVVGRLGTQPGSLISEGVNLVSGYEFGWMFKIYDDKKFMISGLADVSNASYTIVNLDSFIKGIIDSGRVTEDNKLIRDVPALRSGIGFRAAYAFNQVFGMTFYGTSRYGEAIAKDESNDWFFNYGIAFDADLLPKQKVPLGFLLGFYGSNSPDADKILETDPKNFIAQINYTGNDDLSLGLEINLQTYKPVGYEENIKFMNYSFNMRYFF